MMAQIQTNTITTTMRIINSRASSSCSGIPTSGVLMAARYFADNVIYCVYLMLFIYFLFLYIKYNIIGSTDNL